ncbi:hypothetical protein [Sphingobacterium sp.]|uniref:hypothetical protein n=1 Tax=Sphingobacterium sp. TaxID=341027 RepID=UPI0031DB17E0
MIKKVSLQKASYRGMMYSHDFQLGYTYARLHVQQKIGELSNVEFVAAGTAPWQLFRKVEETGQVHLQIYPRHLKNVLYGLIQQNRLVARNVEVRYSFYHVDRKEEHAKFN